MSVPTKVGMSSPANLFRSSEHSSRPGRAPAPVLGAVEAVLLLFCMIVSAASGDGSTDRAPAVGVPFRYHPDGSDIVIVNGRNRFNRPLYGSNTAFFVYAGDLPEILLALPGKGGTLRLGMAVGKVSKWFSDAKEIVARYRAGAMRYQIQDPLLGPGTIAMDVVPLQGAEGAVIQIDLSGDASPVELVWTFGGASGYKGLGHAFDTCRYVPENAVLLKSEDCEQNAFKMMKAGFELRAPCHGSRPITGIVPPGSVQEIANAEALKSPQSLWESSAGQRPIMAGRRTLQAGEIVYFGLERPSEKKVVLDPTQLPAAFAAAEARRAGTAQRVRVVTPDPYLNAAVAAICAAAEGLWDPPTYVHGGAAWHHPYLGWRGAYIGSEFGWHDRARSHFRAFAKVQFKEPATAKPHADPARNLARQAMDSVLYSRGYLPVYPRPNARESYDMQQVYADQLLWHLLWTGDIEFAREMWPVLVDHLGWEKRCFDPDDDGLYENFANTLISDAHHYSGSPCTQASAYNYRALRLMARLAKLLGHDPEPFQRKADKTLSAMNRVLWMSELGWYAEYRDLLGLKRLHPSAELPSIYHPIDSDVPDMFQAYQMLRYVDTAIEHVPVEGDSAVLWASNWTPYIWSVRNVLASEVAHTALAYWQAGQRDAAWKLCRGAILDSMYAGRVPGNCAGTSEHDNRWGGACTDFNCTVGMFGRALVEGLFGILPNMIDGEVLFRPGLPRAWNDASIDTPDIGYTYSRNGNTDHWEFRSRLNRPVRLRLQLAARRTRVAQVAVNGNKADWKVVVRVAEPAIEILGPSVAGTVVEVSWQGDEPAKVQCPDIVGLGEPFTAWFDPARVREVFDPQKMLKDVSLEAGVLRASAVGQLGHRTAFVKLEQGDLVWWAPVPVEIRPPLEICQTKVDWPNRKVNLTIHNNTDKPVVGSLIGEWGRVYQTNPVATPARSHSVPVHLSAKGLVPGTNPISLDLGHGRVLHGAVVDWHPPTPEQKLAFECVNLSGFFNDRVTEIFKHEYRSPRSPYCSLQIPLHGFGDWCYCGKSIPTIDDSALRKAAGVAGRFQGPQGVPLATPGPGDKPNVVFTSQWDNFPKEVAVPLVGHAQHVWFLVAGSTHPMQSQLDNGEVVVTYASGKADRLPLHNPTTWWPIEADYNLKVDGFCIPGPYPPRISLGAGRATLLDLPLNPQEQLRSLRIRCLANEVVVGLMSVTLLRPGPDDN